MWDPGAVFVLVFGDFRQGFPTRPRKPGFIFQSWKTYGGGEKKVQIDQLSWKIEQEYVMESGEAMLQYIFAGPTAPGGR